MKKIAAFLVGFAFFISGFFISDAQALMRLGQINGQQITDIEGLVVFIHSCHNDCQQGDGGNWHKHKGMKCKKKWCSKPSYSQTPPAFPNCGNGTCLGIPDGSLTAYSPLPYSEKVQQQNH